MMKLRKLTSLLLVALIPFGAVGCVDLFDIVDTTPIPPGNTSQWDLNNLINFVIGDVNTFWSNAFAADGLSHLYSPPAGVYYYTVESDTACGLTQLGNAFYCPADFSIYYDENLMYHFLNNLGDFAVALVIAHEWAHMVQHYLGRLGERLTIFVELEADCLAGVWAGNADSRGLLDEGDLSEGFSALLALGDQAGTPWFHPQAHGTSEQRATAFANGFQFGFAACFN